MQPAHRPGAFDTIVSRPENYVRFLDARTAIDDENHVKQVIASLLEPQDGLTVLDVGTGTGADACQIAAMVAPRGKVVGVDLSADMIAEARKRAATADLPVEFVQGDAQALDFADASFDRCRAERIFIHLPDPMAGIGELVRVTRPGGLVVVSDIDGGTIFVNSSDQELATRLVLSLTDDLASGWVGRRLHRYFVEAGLEDVRCVPSVIQNSVVFMRMVFAARLAQMVDAGETTDEEVAQFWAELEDGERAGWLCSGIVCFTVVGRKPA